MNKKEIQKIILFTKEVSELPDELLSDSDSSAFDPDDKTEDRRNAVYEKQARLFEKVGDIKTRLIAYFRAVSGENSDYVGLLGGITFKPKHSTYNTTHFENNNAWLCDKNKLLNLLKMAKTEFEEKARIAVENPENSISNYFKSKEAKGIFLGALLVLITGVVTPLINNEFSSQSTVEKAKIHQADSLVAVDRKIVLDKTVKEVFTNYSQTIQKLKESYAPTSAIIYLNEYVEKETENIEARIAAKSYVHRFASNEILWTEKDFAHFSTLCRARTINRMKEFVQDVENRSQGPFIFSEDKLDQLKDLAKREIDSDKY